MAKVVVWTQAYNAEKTLRRAMDSILQQTYSDLEYYVLDNASTDGTGAIIEEYAKKDPRVFPLSVEKNDLEVCADFLPYILRKSSAEWFVWCDADDAYDITYLEKMIAFAADNQLDIVSSGYRKIDGKTNEVIKERIIHTPLIVQGNDFANRFVEYRGFTIFLWAKIVSTKLLKNKYKFEKKGRHASCCDSTVTLCWFRQAKRAGVYPEALYDYYQYATSVSHVDSYIDLDDYLTFWYQTRAYIASYGPISKKNKAFLYAIYLSLIEELLQLLTLSSFSPDSKLEHIKRMLEEPHMREALSYEPAGEFQILIERPQFVERIHSYIIQQQNQCEDDKLAEQLLRKLAILQKTV